MLKIYLARHGQDEDNARGILNGHRDTKLTEIGISQANELAQHLKEKQITFDKIYSSPLQRAYMTAQIIADKLEVDLPEINPALIERNFGIMTGKKIQEIEAFCTPDIIKAEKITYFLSPENAETFPEMLVRAKTMLELIQKRHEGGKVLFVCHGDIGKMIYAAFYDLSWQEILTHFHFGNSELLVLDHSLYPEARHALS
ncbi:MAG: phosphoglycerate mutase protein [Alphaproteobacteria bacterium]|nr:phosphoglycerate mutase protein [Alphaproteobacteria bacterium]